MSAHAYHTEQDTAIGVGMRQTFVLLLIGTMLMLALGGATFAVLQGRGLEKRIVQIERPSVEQLNRSIIVALDACSSDTKCRAAFVAAAPRGARGARGDTGARGSTGRRGAQGRRGATGATGARGAQGATGPRGRRGAAGPTGAPGPTGAVGPTGAQGAPGTPGANVDRVIAELCRRSPVLKPLLCAGA